VLHLGRLTNIRLEKVARLKLSSLNGLFVSDDEEKIVFNFDNRWQCYKTFFLHC